MEHTLTSKAVAKLVGKSERSVRVVAAEFGLGVLVHPTLRLFSKEDVQRFRVIFADREYVHLTAEEKKRLHPDRFKSERVEPQPNIRSPRQRKPRQRKPKPPKPERQPSEQVQRIKQLHANGLRQTEIARQLGVTRQYVNAALKAKPLLTNEQRRELAKRAANALWEKRRQAKRAAG